MTRPAVLKFGGSSFRTAEAYRRLAETLAERIEADGRPLAVVVSAMPGETEKLRELLREVNPHPADASVAGLLTLADTVGAQLLSAALHRIGCRSTVLAGHQLGFTTGSSFMWARLEDIDPVPLTRALVEHETVIIPGGQAVDAAHCPTWLGKNSSDLSAVAAAVAVGANRCEIYSDVDGIYSADPNLVAGARLLPNVAYGVARSMSLHGAKVLHRGAVQLAEQYNVTILCRSNEAPFPIGSTISEAGAAVSAVIVNLRSTVLRYANHTQADETHRIFNAQGVEAIRFADSPCIGVIGGYLDIDMFQRRHSLPHARVDGIPVVELSGSNSQIHVAQTADEAVRLAQKLHENLATSPETPLSSG